MHMVKRKKVISYKFQPAELYQMKKPWPKVTGKLLWWQCTLWFFLLSI